MGLRWHLAEWLVQRRLDPDALEGALGAAIAPDWLDPTPPATLTMADLAALCAALSCQPGDLLTYDSEDPAEQAARNLSADLFYQSFLNHQAMLEEQPQDE